jgi:hypothetical protein
MTRFRKTIAFVSLFAFASLLNSCAMNADANKEKDSVKEVSCDEAITTFNAAGAAQPNLTLAQLPAGIYTHVSAEVYFERATTNQTGAKTATRVQYTESPNRTTPVTYSQSARCLESTGNFAPFFLSVPVMVNLTTDKTSYAASTLTYSILFQNDGTPGLNISNLTSLGSTGVSTLATNLTAEWNGGYRFTRRTGDTYEFLGIRFDPTGNGITVYGKATYQRTDL